MSLHMSLNLSEFVEQSIVLKNFDVLNVEVCFGVALELLLGFTRIYTFENTNAPKILEIQL